MAGIGFELKKILDKGGLISVVKAYGYGALITAGPMIFSMAFLLFTRTAAEIASAKAPKLTVGNRLVSQSDFLFGLIVETMIIAYILVGIFSLIVVRFISDMLYVGRLQHLIPSFFGVTSVMMLLGWAVYLPLLITSRIPAPFVLLCLVLFSLILVTAVQMNYMSALKDYKKMVFAFAMSLCAGFLLGCGLLVTPLSILPGYHVAASLLLSLVFGYGMLSVWYFRIMLADFHQIELAGAGAAGPELPHPHFFLFLRWFKKYPSLSLTGFFTMLGLYSHIVAMKFSVYGMNVGTLLPSAPEYETPVIFAFLLVLVSQVTFLLIVETRFYPRSGIYFALYNGNGSWRDIQLAEKQMLRVLWRELPYAAVKQILMGLLALVFGTGLLQLEIFSFTDFQVAVFRTLCIGYCLYSIGNLAMQIQLYMSDNAGALLGAVAFGLISTGVSILTALQIIPVENGYLSGYAFGFVTGGAAFVVISWGRLFLFTRNLSYRVLGRNVIHSATHP